MITNNKMKSTGVAVAVLFSVFATNLHAARGTQAGGNRSAASSSHSAVRSSSRPAASANRSMSSRSTSRSAQPSRTNASYRPASASATKPASTKPTGTKPTGNKNPPVKNPPMGPHGGDVVRNHGRDHQGFRGGRIPEERFRAHFGREHRFRMDHPVLVGGHYRFHYDGFAFGVVDPWPPTWIATDAVYVDNVDGAYFLCNPADPGFRVAISVGA